MRLLLQSVLLLVSFCLVYIWHITILKNYTIPFLGVLVLAFLILSARKKGFNPYALLDTEGVGSIFILNTIIFLLIFATGGLNSTLFFLLYFLGFGIALVFEPIVVFVFLLGTIAIFLQDTLAGDVLGNGLKLGSLVLISPLAFFFGREFRKEEKLEEKIEEQAEKIEKTTEELIQAEADKLDEKGIEKVKEILEETEELKKS